MADLKKLEVWFLTGSQHLYGEETLKQVEQHAASIARSLNENSSIPVTVTFKPVVKTPEEITNACAEANNSSNCIGIISLDAYFFTSKNVDQRIKNITETPASSAYAIQPRHSLERDRHGFHEPESVGPWRPGIWLYHEPHAHQP